MRRKQPEPLRVPLQPPWQFAALDRAEALIREIWERHSEVELTASMGHGPISGWWFSCKDCSMQWPCPTFQMVMHYGTVEDPKKYRPLRLIADNEPSP